MSPPAYTAAPRNWPAGADSVGDRNGHGSCQGLLASPAGTAGFRRDKTSRALAVSTALSIEPILRTNEVYTGPLSETAIRNLPVGELPGNLSSADRPVEVSG